MIKIDVCIITRDRCSDLIRCIESLNGYFNYESLIIIDSSTDKLSRDHNLTFLNNNVLKSKLIYRYLQVPLGTQPLCRNYGLTFSKSEYLLYLDDDGYVNESTYRAIYEFLNKYPNYSIVGCRIIQGSEVSLLDPLAKRYLPKFDLVRWAHGSFNLIGNGQVCVDHLQGTCMCFNVDDLNHVGGFSEDLCGGYASFEETDAILRVSKFKREKPMLLLHGSVTHGVAPRLNGYPRDLGLNTVLAYSYARNGTITSVRYFGYFRTILYSPIVIIFNSLSIMKGLKKDYKISRLKSLIYFSLGVVAGLNNKNI